jgi:hypothetical protein
MLLINDGCVRFPTLDFPLGGPSHLQPLRNFRLNNRPVGEKNVKKHTSN